MLISVALRGVRIEIWGILPYPGLLKSQLLSCEVKRGNNTYILQVNFTEIFLGIDWTKIFLRDYLYRDVLGGESMVIKLDSSLSNKSVFFSSWSVFDTRGLHSSTSHCTDPGGSGNADCWPWH